jgi:hypothetical protein
VKQIVRLDAVFASTMVASAMAMLFITIDRAQTTANGALQGT